MHADELVIRNTFCLGTLNCTIFCDKWASLFSGPDMLLGYMRQGNLVNVARFAR